MLRCRRYSRGPVLAQPSTMLAGIEIADRRICALSVYLTLWAAPKPHGVAGSIVVLVIWLYYSSQILFYGAELTKVRLLARGVVVQPRRHAVRTRAALDDPTLLRPTDRLRDDL